MWHKRRTDFTKFFRQVHNSGIARIHLYKKYPESLKLVHMLPAVFTVGCIGLVVLAAIFRVLGAYGHGICNTLWWICLLPILLYGLLVFIDSSIQSRSLKIGLLSIEASFIQLIGYGTGFLRAWWVRCVRKEAEFAAFEHNFYK